MTDPVRPPPPRPAAEWVGPPDAREDVSSHSDRTLLVRVVDEVLHLQHSIGAITRELSDLRKGQRNSQRWEQEAADEITLVKDLRKTVRKWRSRTIGAIIAVFVIVAASYVCAKLGIRVVG